MNSDRFFTIAALVIYLCGATVVCVAGTRNQTPQKPPSAAEASALAKLNTAKDAAAKLDVGAEYLKQYGKSERRREVAQHIAGHIGTVSDINQRIALAERFATVFNAPGEADLVSESLVDAYIYASRAVDAFRLGGTWLQKSPDDVDLMRRLAILATNESIKGNNTFIKQGYDYAVKGIAQIEADRKPANMDAAFWATYKTTHLPGLYREAGVLALRSGDKAATKTHMEKAAGLKSSDPVVYVVLSDMVNEDYKENAQKYQAMPAGAEKTAQLQRTTALLDRLIELYAQTVMVSEGNTQFAEVAKAIRQDLETYYKFRHNGSAEGLQQLLDKYKKQ